MPSIARSLSVALSFVILSSLPFLVSWVGGDTRPFIAATILLALALAFVVWSWDWDLRSAALSGPREAELKAPRAAALKGPPYVYSIAVALAAAWLIAVACHTWLDQIFTIPNDPQRADMLIVVQEGLRRMAQGKNPYTIYHIPWDAPLPYGPMLWAPFAIPMALHADVRFLTVAGQLFVPVACAIAAVVLTARGRAGAGLGCLAMTAAICVNPDLTLFASTGHTPAYWPLLALLSGLVVYERWPAAAVALGLLVVARTTMVAMVPVLAIVVWQRDRAKTLRAMLLLTLAVALPFLPFLLWDARALAYGMYGSYQTVIKGFVWTSTAWVQHSIGITGVLLSNGLQRFVDAFQAIVMAAVYVAAWLALRRGRSPIAWMGVALFAFSMTTLWPVQYLYFDVLLMLAAAVVADALRSSASLTGSPARAGSLARDWTFAAAVCVALVIGGAVFMLPANPVVDAGTAADAWHLRSGFGGPEREGDRTFAWVEGRRASILLPRRSAAPAAIDVVAMPALAPGSSGQRMSAVLNGTLAGDVVLPAGWNQVSFPAPAGAWRIGVNDLELTLASSVSPADAGSGNDRRQLSVAIDTVAVRPAPP